jgi:hypothetical protein
MLMNLLIFADVISSQCKVRNKLVTLKVVALFEFSEIHTVVP